MSTDRDQDLCLSCGFCCDGTLFTRVRLTNKDNPQVLREAGLDVREDFSQYFRQPCPQLKKNACQIYDKRPSQCAKFRCLLLKSFQSGMITGAEAIEAINLARDLRSNSESSNEAKKGYHRFLRQTFGDQNGNPFNSES